MQLIYIGRDKVIYGLVNNYLNEYLSTSYVKTNKGLQNYTDINDLINNGSSLSDCDMIIYAYDILSFDSIVFLKSISNLKRFNLKLLVILTQNLNEHYVEQLYHFGVDFITNRNFEIRELAKIFHTSTSNLNQITNSVNFRSETI